MLISRAQMIAQRQPRYVSASTDDGTLEKLGLAPRFERARASGVFACARVHARLRVHAQGWVRHVDVDCSRCACRQVTLDDSIRI